MNKGDVLGGEMMLRSSAASSPTSIKVQQEGAMVLHLSYGAYPTLSRNAASMGGEMILHSSASIKERIRDSCKMLNIIEIKQKSIIQNIDTHIYYQHRSFGRINEVLTTIIVHTLKSIREKTIGFF